MLGLVISLEFDYSFFHHKRLKTKKYHIYTILSHICLTQTSAHHKYMQGIL